MVVSQNNNTPNVLEEMQNQAKFLHQNKNSELENKFLQAKTLERSGLYKEALLLIKEINTLSNNQTLETNIELIIKNALIEGKLAVKYF